MELVTTRFDRVPALGEPNLEDSDPELHALIQAFINPLEEARDTLANIMDDADGDHSTLATSHFILATDSQATRAALEAALTQRGLADRIIFVSREGLRHICLAWRDYV